MSSRDPGFSRRLRRMTDLPRSARCLNPECTQMCDFGAPARGQQPLFCSTDCRRRYHKTRERLIRRIDRLSTYLARDPDATTADDRDHANEELIQARWLLARFRPEAEQEAS